MSLYIFTFDPTSKLVNSAPTVLNIATNDAVKHELLSSKLSNITELSAYVVITRQVSSVVGVYRENVGIELIKISGDWKIKLMSVSTNSQPISTPTPTPIPTPVPSPTVFLPSTPIPAGYPIAVYPDKCRALIYRTYTGTGSLFTLDWSMVIPPTLTESSRYGMIFRERLTTGNPALGILVKSLSPGTYSVDQETALNKTSTAFMSYSWSSTIKDTSIDDSTSSATIKIEGNQNSYIWGSFEGRLGKLGARILLSGRFACVP